MKIQIGIFLGDAQSTLLFVIAMIPQNPILRKCTVRYILHKSQEKNQPPNVLGRHQSVLQKWKRTGNSNTLWEYSQDIEMEIGIEKSAILIMRSGKRYMTEGIEQTNQEKIRMLGRKGNVQILGNIVSGHN